MLHYNIFEYTWLNIINIKEISFKLHWHLEGMPLEQRSQRLYLTICCNSLKENFFPQTFDKVFARMKKEKDLELILL